MALRTMRELPDFVMAPGSPDMLGWAVHDRDDLLTGTVVDLVVETEEKVIRLIGVRLGDGRHILIHVAALDLNEDRGAVKVFRLSREEIHAQPPYTPPTLSEDIEARYEDLFKHAEPVGAWEPSPLDIPFPPLKARSDRLKNPPFGRKPKSPPPQEVRLPYEREGEGAEVPIKTGIFAASMPWDIADAGHKESPDTPGPEADAEVLWQAEQPGLPSALGGRRKNPEEE
ncbi:hypothetical protein J7643_05465 [bacterium]|nr:hypothetical protein [bacterium]